MRRADRLYEIVQMLRGGRTRRAEDLAQHLEVSVRTIYRDIADLVACGVPIDGEAGVGYVLRPGYLMPPLNFTRSELQALALGARLVEAWSDMEFADAAREALVKIKSALPDKAESLDRLNIFGHALRLDAVFRERLRTIRQAIETSHRIEIAYERLNGEASTRAIRPLALDFWGPVWTLTAWCEAREDFRVFRVDRIGAVKSLGERFHPEPGRRLQDYWQRLKA